MLRRACTVLLSLTTTVVVTMAQAPDDDPLDRIGRYVEDYYSHAQAIVAEETVVIQPLTRDLSPEGFARRVVNEVRVEWNPLAETAAERAVAMRTLVKSTGPSLFDDGQDECADPPAITPEPLAFLMPANREQFVVTKGKPARVDGRQTLTWEFAERNAAKPEFHFDGECSSLSHGDKLRTKVWADAATAEVVRIDQYLTGMVDARLPYAEREKKLPKGRKAERPHTVSYRRADTTLRFKIVRFSDPDETLLLPESIETVQAFSAAYGQSEDMHASALRVTQTFRNYRRFVTGSRMVTN